MLRQTAQCPRGQDQQTGFQLQAMQTLQVTPELAELRECALKQHLYVPCLVQTPSSYRVEQCVCKHFLSIHKSSTGYVVHHTALLLNNGLGAHTKLDWQHNESLYSVPQLHNVLSAHTKFEWHLNMPQKTNSAHRAL